MPKFTIGEGENAQQVEISNEKMLEKLDYEDKSTLEKFLDKFKIKKVEKQEEAEPDSDGTKKEDENLGTDNNITEALKAALNPMAEQMKNLAEKVEKQEQFREEQKESETAGKVDKLLDSAIADGRIAKGEINDWKEKFDDKYKSDYDILEEIIQSKQPDESIKQENQNPDDRKKVDDGNYQERGQGGQGTFKNSEIDDMSEAEYEKHRDKILQSEKSGNVIQDQ